MQLHIYDIGATGNLSSLGSGKNYAVTNLAALPADFTTDFTPINLSAGVAFLTAAMDYSTAAKLVFQFILTSVGASLSGVSIQLQASNVGGTASGVWSNISTAVAAGSTAGSAMVDVLSDAIRRHKFYRFSITATGDVATLYGIASGYAES